MNLPQFCRSTIALSLLVLLSACGSTSKFNRETTSTKSLADYDVIYVADFGNATTKKISNADKFAIYKKSVDDAGIGFAEMIATNLEKTKNPPQVTRALPEGTQSVLRIEGDITLFERGNMMAKLLLPFAGSTKFNASVRFIDQATNEKVGKNSNPLGGGYAASQTTNAFMKGAADKIAEQVELLRNPTAKK
jgi:hypothetical protein